MSEYFNETMDRLAYWMEGNRDASMCHPLSIDGEEKYVITCSWRRASKKAAYDSIVIEAKKLLSDETYYFYLNARIGKPHLYKKSPSAPKELVNRLVELFGAVTK